MLLSFYLMLLLCSTLGEFTMQHGQLRGQQWQHECNIEQLSAAEPTRRLVAEAGVVEVWEPNEEQFRCTGVAAVRHVIEPKGLLLPSYTNAPYITYVIQGGGVQGVIVPGCPETFESGGGSSDQHQRVFRVRDGDVIGSPAGMIQWTYNDGDTPLVSITLLDLTNPHNQLDLNFRSFYLAGNPQGSIKGRQIRGPREVSGKNIFNGFDDDLLSNIFNIDANMIQSLKGKNDERGCIIRVEHDLEFLTPEIEEIEQEKIRRSPNGVEETLCYLRFKRNIDQASDADVFSRHGGRINTLNGYKFPLLQYLRFSAERGVFNENAMMTPHLEHKRTQRNVRHEGNGPDPSSTRKRAVGVRRASTRRATIDNPTKLCGG
ncbi:hypothetical protein RND81_05G062800 [Saponaria officinalis]|uniref:Cupin type-1 domain-containing protein n=1 Tax=Saponaria officinalis TaxID=3572 RepID=A0AAW1KV59_SAPOF